MSTDDSTKRPCSIDGCDAPFYSFGWCQKHYRRWRAHGDPLKTKSRGVCAVEGCERPHHSHGLCQMHVLRWQRYGDTSIVLLPKRPQGLSALEALWFYIDKDASPDGCWEWTGSRDGSGYGTLVFEGKTHRASRLMWETLNRPLERMVLVRHKCDNPPCCRPDHLEPGSSYDNAMDSVNRGRARRAQKLSDEQVMELRRRYAAGETSDQLAADYGITANHVVGVASGRARKRVPGAIPEIVARRRGGSKSDFQSSLSAVSMNLLWMKLLAIERILYYEEDDYDNDKPVWDVVSSAPCYRKALNGQETITAQRMSLDVSVKIVVPFGTDVTTDDRLLVDGKRYGISYIPEGSPGLSVSVECFCKLMGEAD